MKKMVVLSVMCFLTLNAMLYADGIADYFNGDCLGFAVIEKPGTIDQDFSKTGLYKISQEQEVKDFTAGLISQAEALLVQGGQQAGFDFKAILGMLRRLEGGVGFGFLALDIEKEFPELALVIEGVSKQDIQLFTEVTGTIRTFLQAAEGQINMTNITVAEKNAVLLKNPNGKEEVCYILEERNLYVTFTKTAMEKIFDNKANKLPHPEQKKGLKHCGLNERGGILVYLDGKQIVDLLTQGVKMEEGEDSEEYRAFQAFHFDDLTSIMIHSSVAAPGFVNKFYLGLKDAPQGIGKLISTKKLTGDVTAEVPVGAVSFSAFTLDLVKVWDAVMSFLAVVEPDEIQNIQTEIQNKIEQPFGIKLRDGFLASFAGDFMFFQILPDNPGIQQIPEIVISAKLKDPQQVRLLINGAFSIAAMGAPHAIGLKPGKVGETPAMFVDIKRMQQMNFKPGYVITKDKFVIGTSSKALAMGLNLPAENITANPQYKAVTENVDDAEALALSFTDVKQTFSKTYQALGMFAMMMPQIGQKVGLDLTKLPVGETISKHLFAMKSASQQVAGGVLVSAYGPFDYISAAATVSVGVGAGITMRRKMGMGRRGGGRRDDMTAPAAPAGSETKLKELYNACRIYSFDNDGKFPASLSALYPDYVMDLKLFTTGGGKIDRAGIDTKGAFVLVKGVSPYADGKTVFMHERPAPGAKTVKAITVDGTITTVNVDDLKKGAGNPEKF